MQPNPAPLAALNDAFMAAIARADAAGLLAPHPSPIRSRRLRNRVRAVRIEAGLSQRQLGLRTGLSRVTLRSIERDDGYTPNSAVLMKVAEALGQDMHELFWTEAEVA